jgi:hypothetical protein
MFLAVLLALAFFVADFTIAPLMYRGDPRFANPWFLLIFVLLGVIGAQVAVLSAWLVWSEGNFWWRLLIHWGLAAVCCWIWIAGLATVARGTELIDGHCIIALSMTILSAAIQAPLWLSRQMFAWRLVRAQPDAIAPERTSTIGNLMLAMSIAAVALAFARLVPTDVGSPQELVAIWAFLTGWSAAIGLLGALPAAACLLWPRWVSHGLLWYVLHVAAIVTAVWCFIIGVCLFQKSTVPFDDLACTTIVLISFFGTLALAAFAARGFGYRLILGKASRLPGAISSELEVRPAGEARLVAKGC